MTSTQTSSADAPQSESQPQYLLLLKAAALQVQLDREHAAMTGAHVIEADKKSTPLPSPGK